MAYANGRVPKDLLEYFEGRWFFPGTLRRWRAFRDEVKAETGETLELTSAYRDYDEQVKARQEYGIMAAVPGTSSHGGIWTGSTTGRGGLPSWVSGLETGALDVGDYYNIPWATFDRLATKHGFIADIVVPKELWHIVDLDPWGHNLPEEEELSAKAEAQIADLWEHWRGGEKGKQTDGEQALMLRAIYNQLEEQAKAIRQMQDLWEAWRYGEKGVQTHGPATGELMSRLGAIELNTEEK